MKIEQQISLTMRVFPRWRYINTMKDRLVYLDFIKAISIILVVFCHYVIIPNESVVGNVVMLIAWAAVPCFLMCSGYILLFKTEKLRKSISRILRTVFVMIAWKGLYYLFYYCTAGVRAQTREMIEYLFFFKSIQGINTAHFWFMNAYILCLCLVPIITPAFAQKKVDSILWIVLMCYLPNQLLYGIQYVLNTIMPGAANSISISGCSEVFPFSGGYSFSIPFFLLGGILRLLEDGSEKYRRNKVSVGVLLFTAGFAGLAIIKHRQCGTWRWGGAYLEAGYQWNSTVLMSTGLFNILQRMSRNRIALFLAKHVGKNTMGVFYLHVPMLAWSAQYIYTMLPYAVWVNFAKTASVIVATVLIAYGVKRIPYLRRII